MTSPLLSDDEMAAIREVGELGMVTPVQIFRQTVVERFDPEYGYSDDDDARYDFGDDELTYTFGDETGGDLGPPVAEVNGWFVSTPLTRDASDVGAQLVVVNQLILRVPVGTDIRPLDIVRKVGTNEDYVAIDPNTDDTWPEWTKTTLRRQE